MHSERIVTTDHMKVLDGDVNIHSDLFKKNYEDMKRINEDLDSKINVILQGGGEAYNKRHLSRGKFLGKPCTTAKHGCRCLCRQIP